jgi:lysophospholipase L1-like esterase
MSTRFPIFTILLLLFSGNVMADPLYGRENLAAFYAGLVSSESTGNPVGIHFEGDSKVAGIGVSDGYRLDQLMMRAANGYPITTTYEGLGGENSYIWANGKAASFVSQHPTTSLLIVDFGTNDFRPYATGGAQSLAQIKANHLAAIATIRASRSPSQLSILLLGQTPANNWNPDYNQTTENMTAENAVLKEVAEETNSAFFDTLELFTRAHAEAGWMEQLPVPAYGDGNVHPGNPLNYVLVGELGKALFPLPFKFEEDAAEGICTPALQNGWAPWTVGSAYIPRARLKDGIVYLDGLIKKPGVTSPAETVLFTLPPGFRPAVNRFVSVASDNNGGSVTLQILAAGGVRLGGAFSGTSFVSLDGISFRVD